MNDKIKINFFINKSLYISIFKFVDPNFIKKNIVFNNNSFVLVCDIISSLR